MGISFMMKPVFHIRRSVTGLAVAEGTAEAGISFMMKPVTFEVMKAKAE